MERFLHKSDSNELDRSEKKKKKKKSSKHTEFMKI